jgi:hypothetical protein
MTINIDARSLVKGDTIVFSRYGALGTVTLVTADHRGVTVRLTGGKHRAVRLWNEARLVVDRM